jgi:hypothetical protein
MCIRNVIQGSTCQVQILTPKAIPSYKYSVIQKDGLNFVRLYFLNYTWYVEDLRNI